MHASSRSMPLGLPLWDRPLAEEPAHGLLLRLCAINGYPYLKNVTRETGLSASHLHHGERFADLARLVRCDEVRIAADSFRVEGETFVDIRGQKVGYYRDFDCTRRRACPACLRESAHHRFWWDLAFISTCPRHGVDLVERCACREGRPLSWFDGSLVHGRCCLDGDIRTLAGKPSDPAVAAVDRYMAGRLGVETAIAVPALDGLSIYDAVDVLERVGALHAGGWSKLWKRSAKVDLSPAENRAAAFAVLRDGRMQEVLETVYQQFLASPTSAAPTLTTAYGWFYHWYNLKGHRDFSTHLTEEIYRHASTRFRIDLRAAGNKTGFLSAGTAEAIDRYNSETMTLVAATKECGKHLMQVRRLAIHYGLMRTEKVNGRPVSLQTADVAVMKFLFARWVNKQEAAAILGINPKAVLDLIDVGALTPFIPGRTPGSQVYRFLRDDVEGLLARLGARVDPSRRDRTRQYALSTQSWKGPPSIQSAVMAILRGSLIPVHEDADAVGLRRFHLKRIDVRIEGLKIAKDGGEARVEPAAPCFERWRARMKEIEAAAVAHQDGPSMRGPVSGRNA